MKKEDKTITYLSKSVEVESKYNLSTIIKIGSAAILTVLGGYLVIDSNKPPKFSETTHSHTVQPGEGLERVAAEIKGIGTDKRDAIYHIQHDPQNAEALSDGLQVGESIQVPDSVETR